MAMQLLNQTGFRAGWLIGSVPPHKLCATLIVKGTFRLKPGAPAEPLPEDDQPHLTGDTHVDEDVARPLIYASDFAPAKPFADVLLSGTCHVPGKAPATVCRVDFSVGAWQKSLAVIGDRAWKGGFLGRSMTDPAPFREMPLSYERSFGGAGFARNPLGRGFAEETLPDGSRATRLPNIEAIDALIRDPGSRPEPAGFGPMPMTWPQRMAKAGTYDKAWLRDQWPNLPRDTDWSIFNAAPADQQLRGFLRGDERVVFQNLHATHPRYESALPGFRVRWFVDDDAGGNQMRFREATLHLDTLLADLDAELLTLTWRGVIDIRTKQMKEVGAHLIVREAVATPPPPSDHYLQHLKRLQEEKAAGPKGPSSMPGVPWPKTPEPSTAWVKDAEKELEAMKAEFGELTRAQEQQRRAVHAKMSELGASVPRKVKPSPGPADSFTAASQAYERLKQRMPDAAKLIPAPKKADFDFTPPGVPNVPKLEERVPAEPWTRERVLKAVAERRPFEGEDLSGLDLSGADLSNADLSGAVLAEANLAGCTLAGSKFVAAALTKADLTAADLSRAVLTQADLTGAKLAKAKFAGATLDDADLSGTSLAGLDLSGVCANGALFLEADVTGTLFMGASLELAEFDGAAAAGADFSQARLTSASLAGLKAPKARFTEAVLLKTAASEGDFTGAVFARADAAESIWEQAKLDGADFSGAQLSRASFEAASLKQATFVGCVARRGRFPEADLEGADFSGADLFRASFEAARLNRARLPGCNLYESEFYQAQIRDADLRQANVKGTKLA